MRRTSRGRRKRRGLVIAGLVLEEGATSIHLGLNLCLALLVFLLQFRFLMLHGLTMQIGEGHRTSAM